MAELQQRNVPTAGPELTEEENQAFAEWKERYGNGTRDRRRLEPVWQICQSFIQNRQWIGWDFHERRVIQLPNPDDRERVTVNVLTQYLQTIIGKLTQDDFRPDLTFRREDVEGMAFARQAQRAIEYAWDEELEADEVLMEAILKMTTFGTSGIRVKADPNYGPIIGDVPVGPDGRLIFDATEARRYVAEAQQRGETVQFRTAREGRMCWEALSPFNIVAPPGIENERNFPWIIFEKPVAIEDLRIAYGAKAESLKEEKLRAIDMIGIRENTGPENGGSSYSGDLRGHVMLKTGYRMGTVEKPMGEQFFWAGDTILHRADSLPFTVKGMGKVGWVPLRYHKVAGRFWGIGVVEPGIGPQKQRNRSRSQWIEMKDRAGLGRVYAHKGVITQVNKPKGGVFELVEILPGHEIPKETQGVPPGPWLAQDVSMSDGDLDRVMGLRGDVISNLPAGVSAYSAYALFAEQDDRRVGPVLKDVRFQVAKLVKVTVAGCKTYWGPAKQITFTGENDMMDTLLFNAAKLPDDCYVRVGKGAPLPQSQAAEAQKIFDIFDRSISSGQVLPLDWLYESLAAGKAQPLPKRDQQVQGDKADLENHIMSQGGMPRVMPYDNDELHVQKHRQAQSAWAYLPDMQQAAQLIEQHIQQHMSNARMKAMQAMTNEPTNPGGSPNKPLEGNGRDAGFGQQHMAQQQLPPGGGDATVPAQ